jgi:hypothetical protein
MVESVCRLQKAYNLLASDEPAAGATRLSQWLAENREQVGKRYASEVARHYTKTA